MEEDVEQLSIPVTRRHLAAGDNKKALQLIKQATAVEDEMPLSYGPPSPVKPSHELFGELLLEAGQPAEARDEFERALERAPRRALSLLGLAASGSQGWRHCCFEKRLPGTSGRLEQATATC